MTGRQLVTCTECGVEGFVHIRRYRDNDTVDVDDFIEHSPECSFYKRQPSHLREKKWRRQERDANTLVGAHATPASGALGCDGDGRSFHRWRTESKGTKSAEFRLYARIWAKVHDGALEAGEEPLLHIRFNNVQARATRNWVVVRPEWVGLPPEEVTPRASVLLTPTLSPDPQQLPLKPPALLMPEATFRRLKEEIGESS